MTLHYHGTPLTPRSELEKMKGKHMCVSFANPNDAEWCQTWAQSVMWDNGAFVFYRQDKPVTDWSKFYAWVEPRLGHPHWAVVPDVIGGGVEDNLALIRQWPFRKDIAAVVWHLDEPIEHLLALIDLGFSKVCFGSAGDYWQVGSDAWARKVDEAFNAIIRHFGRIPWIHMLRGLAVVGAALVLRDAVQEQLGKDWVLTAIAVGAILSWFVSDPFLVVASVTAFVLAELADFAIYTPLRKNNLALAVMASGAVGAVVDSAVFLWVAFGSLAFIEGQIVGKMWMTLAAALVLFCVRNRVKETY